MSMIEGARPAEGVTSMRGLEESLARIARRETLRERANSGRGGTHRGERPAPPHPDPSVADAPSTPSVSPVVDEVTAALQSVVRRNPGVFATVVVQEADTAWSVWIGEWDGTLRTRVTQLEADSSAASAALEPDADPDPNGDTIAFPVPAAAAAPPAPPATLPPATLPPATLPTVPAPRPAMNDRVAGRIAEMLRREAARETRGVDA